MVIAILLKFAFKRKGEGDEKEEKALRIAAGITAFIIIGGILFVTNAFVGNPISYLMAKRGVERYVAQNYSFLDLELEKPVYNFKYPAYMVRAKSRTSMDTHFGIYYRNGKVEWDDYQSNVLGLFNTAQRLSDEYSALARTIISSDWVIQTIGPRSSIQG